MFWAFKWILFITKVKQMAQNWSMAGNKDTILAEGDMVYHIMSWYIEIGLSLEKLYL